jgi:hypothetical protein
MSRQHYFWTIIGTLSNDYPHGLPRLFKSRARAREAKNEYELPDLYRVKRAMLVVEAKP